MHQGEGLLNDIISHLMKVPTGVARIPDGILHDSGPCIIDIVDARIPASYVQSPPVLRGRIGGTFCRRIKNPNPFPMGKRFGFFVYGGAYTVCNPPWQRTAGNGIWQFRMDSEEGSPL